MKLFDVFESAKGKSHILNESGIQLPRGTKSVKLTHHRDMDGVFSAIVAFNQLVKQGIKPNRIKISGIQYGDDGKDKQGLLNKFKKSKGQATVLVDFARLPDEAITPDFWSDHHAFDGEKPKAAGKIGATDWKSDTSHLAILRTNNMVDGATLKAVDIVDSAGYSNIKDIIEMPKKFKEKGRMERLAILCNALLTKTSLLSNDKMLSHFIKTTKPSLVSFYNNILKFVRLTKIQEEAIKELAKKSPNWERVEKARSLMPTQDTKEQIVRSNKVPLRDKLTEDAIDDYEELEKLKKKGTRRNQEENKRFKELSNSEIDEIRNKREKEMRAAPGSGKFKSKGVAVVQSNPKSQRYLWTQLNKKGLKHPFVIKKYPTMIQISVNPELDANIKELIDLNVIREDVMKRVQKKFGTKYNEWAFNIINKESGGHKGITNITALSTLGIMPKKDRQRLRELEEIKKRITSLKVYGRGKLSEEDKKKLEDANKILKKKTITAEEKSKYEKIKNDLITKRTQLKKNKEKLSEKDSERLKEVNKMLRRTVLPDEERAHYEKLKKILMPTMETLMPEKASEMEDLLNKKAKFGEQRNKIMNEIEEEFIKAFKRYFNASTSLPIMGKNLDVVIPFGKEELALESFVEELLNT